MRKITKQIGHLFAFKDNFLNKILALLIILLFVVTSFSAAKPQDPTITMIDDQTRSIVWDVTVNFNEPGGAYDYTVFGEAPDANDGPPVDFYDVVKPPVPMPSYIRAWLNDNLPFPYNKLWKDYRHYSDTAKVWNLSVLWYPVDEESPTTITMSWNLNEFIGCEYASVNLCTNVGVILQNMLVNSTYTFTCPALVPQAFKIICLANQPPYVPSNPNPSNGSTGVSVIADLSWTGGDPNPGDTVTYDVYFGTSSSPPKLVSNQSGLSYDPGTLTYSTLYYWKIVAWDNHGVSRAGPLWHFTTGVQPNQPPYVPSNPNPSNGSTGLSINADLSWTGGDPDPGDTVTYDVYFGVGSSPQKVASNISVSTYDPGTLAYYTYYYWRIVAWDNHGSSRAGPLWHFRTASLPNRPPYAPSNPSPANGSTEVSVNADLSWAGGDPDTGDYVTYDVYFGCSFPLTKKASNISGTSHALDNLLYCTKYFWKIVAWDNHQCSNASQNWSFTTKTDTTPPSLAITSPKKGFLYVNLLGGIIQWTFPIFITTLVIGHVDVTATASDSQSGMNRVEFYLDGILKANDTTEPYSWTWSEPGFVFQYLITVTAYDNAGNPSSMSRRVWKIL